jgi:hypothetical protein
MSSRSQAQLTASTPTFTPVASGVLQRQCACGPHAVAGGKCTQCREQGQTLQHSSATEAGSLTTPSIVDEVLRSPGQPLDGATRAFMEPRFGHDFSRVRVHTDAKAAESAFAVNALAYTVGQDVVLGMGQYAPHTALGEKLLAHELTHVVQQAGILTKPSVNLAIGSVSSPLEREAQHISACVRQINTGTTSEDNFPTNRLKGNQHHSIAMHTTRPGLLQRQEICEPEGFESGSVVYDYENQVCRQAERD